MSVISLSGDMNASIDLLIYDFSISNRCRDHFGLVFFVDLIELDFSSLYPNIIVTRNVSPEKNSCECLPYILCQISDSKRTCSLHTEYPKDRSNERISLSEEPIERFTNTTLRIMLYNLSMADDNALKLPVEDTIDRPTPRSFTFHCEPKITRYRKVAVHAEKTCN
ncbi:hypothetical protein GCM10009000_083750 [Halobacterium noricense]